MNNHAAPILKRLPDGPCTMAEVGVAAGLLSRELLERRQDLTLWMIDSWQVARPGSRYYDFCLTNHDYNGCRSGIDVLSDMVKTLAVKMDVGERARVMAASSLHAADVLKHHAFDLVFIDADHSEAGCREDIEAWWPLVKPGGWLAGHDFGKFRDDGVGRAVLGFSAMTGAKIEHDDDSTWFIRNEVA